MAIKTIRIHPAIGIARVGNSPTEFFIGPERPLDHTPPAGGYKDANCRVKRQAARFRLFAYDENDQVVQEITAADGDITWTAHLVNRKAVALQFSGSGLRNPTITGADRPKLIVDPGARTLHGPDQKAAFDTGTFAVPGTPPQSVPLGEIRTDTQGRLLVLGGFGKSSSPNGKPISSTFNNDWWHDDVADGPVSATVKLPSGTFEAVGAWAIVAPPKFAPPIDHSIPLYDRLFQFFVDNGLLPPFNDPSPSYTRYIYPILQRAREIRGVYAIPGLAHKWVDPVIDPSLRNAIFSKLAKPGGGGGDMPMLAGGADLTATQYGIMQLWQSGSFTNDWTGVPPPPPDITAEGLDRAALENCVGAAFFPGIEAGEFLISDAGLYSAAYRLDPAKVQPGDVTARMALPWQTDFYACKENWWPPARPNVVLPQGGTTCVAWAKAVGSSPEMVDKWSLLGFVVRDGEKYVNTEECPSAFINLLTPGLNFKDVPRGPMGMSRKSALAVVFEVESPGAAVTLNYVSGPSHPRLQRLGGSSVTVGPTSGSQIVKARLWITYETGPVGEAVTDSAVIQDAGSGQQWTVQIIANTVDRKKAAAALVLDHSGSMSEDRGDGIPKIQGLREAVSIFVDVMLQDDGVALVRFNQDAQLLQAVTPLGSPADPFDPGRTAIKTIVGGAQLDPAGQTSIGDGIAEGRTALNAASGFDVNSLVVLTDGVENSPLFIADVAAQIDELTYAVGLGKPENISAEALQTISGNNGGYLLITGAITGDQRFLMQKYFLQILAGISNAEIVLDPQGEVAAGVPVAIPFPLTEADAGVDVILLSPDAGRINFRLQSPSGYILDPAAVKTHTDTLFVSSDGVSYYRIRLPFEYLPDRFDDRGTWRALLDIGGNQEPSRGGPRIAGVGALPHSNAEAVATNSPLRLTHVAPPSSFPSQARSDVAPAVSTRFSIPYSLIVHTYSDLRLRASAHQASFAPGSEVSLAASVLEYDIPLEDGLQVWADVVRPGGGTIQIDLRHQGGGDFVGVFATSAAGVYQIRLQAAGRSRQGWPFRREQTLTAAARYGGDPGGGQVGGQKGGDSHALCALVECLLRSGALSPDFLRRLRDQGIDIERLLACVCQGGPAGGDQAPDR